MGWLLDRGFWASEINRLSALEPRIGQPMDQATASEIRRVACAALTTLTNDPSFESDLGRGVAAWHAAQPVPGPGADFDSFLNQFLEIEAQILADAGVDTAASRALDREIRSVARQTGEQSVERLRDKINFLQKLACDPKAADDPRRPLGETVLKGTKGVRARGHRRGRLRRSSHRLWPIW